MGKSQLKQMKESLKERGLLGVKPSQRAKIQKAQKENQKDKINPYELKFTKTKHEVLNRKVKGIKGKPGVARKRATENRERNLLPEMLDKKKDSTFDDKRIGEKNPNMSIEDKMFDRFVQEQKRKQKGSLFNLEEDTLTHMGQSLSTIDDFDAMNSEEEDDGHGGIDFKTVRHDHFGGFGDEEPLTQENTGEDGRKKSKAEVMKEVIAKSKFHKQIRQKQKEDDFDLGENLDAEFDELRDLLLVPQNTKTAALKAVIENDIKDYDKFVRELASDKRAKPTDRLKTEEEKAMEEKSKLEKLERERLSRMKSDNLVHDVQRLPQADDLSDRELDNPNNQGVLQYDKDGVLISNIEQDIPLSESDEDEEESEEDEESGDEVAEIESDMDNSFEQDTITAEDILKESSSESEKECIEKKVKELPFVFTAPSTYQQLCNYTNNRTSEELDTIITRIRVLHSVRLGGDNRKKLETLLNLLHQSFETTCRESWSSKHINILQKHIFELSLQFQELATSSAIEKLKLIQKSFLKKCKFPSIADMMYLLFIERTFSTSDFRHPVIIPALTYIGQCLSLAPITNEKDAFAGLFLCRIALRITSSAKRHVPEVVNFLYRLVRLLQYTKTTALPKAVYPNHPLDKYITVESEIVDDSPINFSSFLEQVDFTESRGRLLIATYRLLLKQATLLSESPSFLDIFRQFSVFLDGCTCKNVLGKDVDPFYLQMKKALLFRRPLQLQKRKPVAIASYVPKFHEKFSIDRKSNDPNRERAEAMKLKHQHQKEFKGAVRELKRDAGFIATQKLKEIKASDDKYKRKINTIMGQLSTQEGAMRGYEKEKKKARR